MRHQLTLDYRHLPERNGYLVRALLELQGEARPDAARTPLHLSLVLDRSGSMNGEPLEAATRAAAELVRRLAPEDVVSVVAFDDHVETVVAPHAGGAESDVSERILHIDARGSTNLSGGWLRGRQLVQGGRADGALHRVFVLTDGHANCGITDHAELTALLAQSRANGISTSCVGFGEGYDGVLLKAMADAGGGNLFHIERADQAALAFGDELAGLQTLAGQNLQVTVTLDASVDIAQLHHDWPYADTPEGRAFELGDLYAREPKRMLIEFFCATAPDANTTRVLASLRIRADVREADGSITHVSLQLPVAATLEGAGAQSPFIEREVLLSRAAQARNQAAEMVRQGNAEQAGVTLNEMYLTLQSAPAEMGFAEDLADLESLARKFAEQQANESDARYLNQKAYNTRRGKSAYDRQFTRRPNPPGPPA